MTMQEKIARAIADDLLKNPRDGGNHGCLIPHSAQLDCFIIRGHIDLYSLADAVLAVTLSRKQVPMTDPRGEFNLANGRFEREEMSEPQTPAEPPIALMQRVWANLYYNEEDAGNTFQQTLNEVVDWLAARNALPSTVTRPDGGAPHGCKRAGGFVDTGCNEPCDCHISLPRPQCGGEK